MKTLRPLWCVFSILFLLLTLALPASADEWNKKTRVSINEPFRVPGLVLPAGTYYFQLFDSPSIRHIVQVWDATQTKLLATIIAIPAYRENAPEKAIIHLEEDPHGGPEAVHLWFYPGENVGWEFYYPHHPALNG